MCSWRKSFGLHSGTLTHGSAQLCFDWLIRDQSVALRGISAGACGVGAGGNCCKDKVFIAEQLEFFYRPQDVCCLLPEVSSSCHRGRRSPARTLAVNQFLLKNEAKIISSTISSSFAAL